MTDSSCPCTTPHFLPSSKKAVVLSGWNSFPEPCRSHVSKSLQLKLKFAINLPHPQSWRREGLLFILATHLAYTWNNHTEIVLIKSLPGFNSSFLLANSHILINLFLLNLCITTWLWLTGKILTYIRLRPEIQGVLPHCLLPPRILFCFPAYLSSALSTRPRQFL